MSQQLKTELKVQQSVASKLKSQKGKPTIKAASTAKPLKNAVKKRTYNAGEKRKSIAQVQNAKKATQLKSAKIGTQPIGRMAGRMAALRGLALPAAQVLVSEERRSIWNRGTAIVVETSKVDALLFNPAEDALVLLQPYEAQSLLEGSYDRVVVETVNKVLTKVEQQNWFARSGEKDVKLVLGECQPEEPAELETWSPVSQESYRYLRNRAWNECKHKDCHTYCRARGLWSGGGVASVRHRLLQYDCNRQSLSALDVLTESGLKELATTSIQRYLAPDRPVLACRLDSSTFLPATVISKNNIHKMQKATPGKAGETETVYRIQIDGKQEQHWLPVHCIKMPGPGPSTRKSAGSKQLQVQGSTIAKDSPPLEPSMRRKPSKLGRVVPHEQANASEVGATVNISAAGGYDGKEIVGSDATGHVQEQWKEDKAFKVPVKRNGSAIRGIVNGPRTVEGQGTMYKVQYRDPTRKKQWILQTEIPNVEELKLAYMPAYSRKIAAQVAGVKLQVKKNKSSGETEASLSLAQNVSGVEETQTKMKQEKPHTKQVTGVAESASSEKQPAVCGFEGSFEMVQTHDAICDRRDRAKEEAEAMISDSPGQVQETEASETCEPQLTVASEGITGPIDSNVDPDVATTKRGQVERDQTMQAVSSNGSAAEKPPGQAQEATASTTGQVLGKEPSQTVGPTSIQGEKQMLKASVQKPGLDIRCVVNMKTANGVTRCKVKFIDDEKGALWIPQSSVPQKHVDTYLRQRKHQKTCDERTGSRGRTDGCTQETTHEKLTTISHAKCKKSVRFSEIRAPCQVDSRFTAAIQTKYY